MPQPSQGTGKDPSQRKRTELDPIALMKNKTNTPAMKAATNTENEAKKSGLRGLREALGAIEAEIVANMKEQAEKKEQERRALLKKEIIKNVAHARAKQNKEEELRGGRNSASGGEKKCSERTRSSSGTDKSKRKETVKKQVS